MVICVLLVPILGFRVFTMQFVTTFRSYSKYFHLSDPLLESNLDVKSRLTPN